MTNYSAECSFIVEQIKNAYNVCANDEIVISDKSSFDLVTTWDRKIERYLSQKIKERFPDDVIQGEEYSSKAFSSSRLWTIDPIDGTVNFANGINMYGTQCSLIVNGKIVVGVIYLPCSDETVWAIDGVGSYCNDRKLVINNSIPLNHTIVSFGDYSHANTSSTRQAQHDVIRKIYPQISKIRMFGAACIEFAFVALGRTHGTVVTTTNLWDIAPGILICKEAGAVITNCNGDKHCLGDDGVIVAATKELSECMVQAYRECLR